MWSVKINSVSWMTDMSEFTFLILDNIRFQITFWRRMKAFENVAWWSHISWSYGPNHRQLTSSNSRYHQKYNQLIFLHEISNSTSFWHISLKRSFKRQQMQSTIFLNVKKSTDRVMTRTAIATIPSVSPDKIKKNSHSLSETENSQYLQSKALWTKSIKVATGC